MYLDPPCRYASVSFGLVGEDHTVADKAPCPLVPKILFEVDTSSPRIYLVRKNGNNGHYFVSDVSPIVPVGLLCILVGTLCAFVLFVDADACYTICTSALLQAQTISALHGGILRHLIELLCP